MTAADGRTGPPAEGLVMPECYPYTTLVGAPELGYIERAGLQAQAAGHADSPVAR